MGEAEKHNLPARLVPEDKSQDNDGVPPLVTRAYEVKPTWNTTKPLSANSPKRTVTSVFWGVFLGFFQYAKHIIVGRLIRYHCGAFNQITCIRLLHPSVWTVTFTDSVIPVPEHA